MSTAETLQPVDAFPDIQPVSRLHAITSLGRAAHTLFATPEHVKLHRVMEDTCIEEEIFQPVHPPVEETIQQIHEDISQTELAQLPQADRARLTYLGGILIQFGDYIPGFHDTIKVPYENITTLRQAITEHAQKAGPLNYAEQLDVALDSTSGDMIESLWRLFITSRLHARWLDSNLVEDMPSYSQDEKINLMLEWRRAVAACKEPQPGLAQDPNGDTYYTWTHALAKVAFTLTPKNEGVTTRSTVHIFEHGTDLMHKIVHTFFNKQGVPSDHSIAARYGNAIGQTLIDTVRKTSQNE